VPEVWSVERPAYLLGELSHAECLQRTSCGVSGGPLEEQDGFQIQCCQREHVTQAATVSDLPMDPPFDEEIMRVKPQPQPQEPLVAQLPKVVRPFIRFL
jgi:hypothetical protein